MKKWNSLTIVSAGILAVSCEKPADEPDPIEVILPRIKEIQSESNLSDEQMVNLISRRSELYSLMRQVEDNPAPFGESELTIQDIEEFIETSRKTIEDFSEDMNASAFNSFVVLVQMNEGNVEEGKDMLRKEVVREYLNQRQRGVDSSFVGAVDKVAERDPKLKAICSKAGSIDEARSIV